MSHTKRTKKEIKRINWSTVKKVICSLHENGKMKKTLLATTCRMVYDKFKMYLEWLELMQLIRREVNEESFEELVLTDNGRIIYYETCNSLFKHK